MQDRVVNIELDVRRWTITERALGQVAHRTTLVVWEECRWFF